MLLSTAGSAGTRVVARPLNHSLEHNAPIVQPLETMLGCFLLTVLPSNMGVPAQDAFLTKLWTTLLGRAVRDDATALTTFPNPRSHSEPRTQIPAYLVIARGIRCVPERVIVTDCYRA